MKIQYLSDLHLEFNSDISDYQIAECGADLIILAGDVGLSRPYYFEWVLSQTYGKPTLMVLGNHEFYHNEVYSTIDAWKSAFKGTHVQVLENDCVEIDDVTFVGATLWTDYCLFGKSKEADAKLTAGMRLNDHRLIRINDDKGKRIFSTEDAHNLHKESLRFFESAIQSANTEKTVVISHHAPSDKSVDAIYEGDQLNAAFASDLTEWVLTHKPTLWLHGHMHNSSSYHIGDTLVMCNPRGYSPYEINPKFADEAVIFI